MFVDVAATAANAVVAQQVTKAIERARKNCDEETAIFKQIAIVDDELEKLRNVRTVPQTIDIRFAETHVCTQHNAGKEFVMVDVEIDGVRRGGIAVNDRGSVGEGDTEFSALNARKPFKNQLFAEMLPSGRGGAAKRRHNLFLCCRGDGCHGLAMVFCGQSLTASNPPFLLLGAKNYWLPRILH